MCQPPQAFMIKRFRVSVVGQKQRKLFCPLFSVVDGVFVFCRLW